MKCEYCGDKILKFQKFRTRIDHEGKEKKYHEGCDEILLDKLISKVKSNLA